MAKKINKDSVTIKKLFKRGIIQKKNMQLLELKMQKVSHWPKYKMKSIQRRRNNYQKYISAKYDN